MIQDFSIFLKFLIEKNKQFNLTTITDELEAKEKHFNDSLQGLEFLGKNIIDIGAGAGFPGIVLALASEDKNFTLVETVGKKANFLIEAVKLLGLKNVTVIKSRVEDLDKTILYDTAVVRAVAPLNVLIEYSLPYLKQGATLLAYKGANYKEEIIAAKNALSILGGEVDKIIEYTLNVAGEHFNRAIICIKKVKESPSGYPRSGNKPRLKPL